jgi:hypothetical protein
MYWMISDKPPAEIEDLIHSTAASRNPLELTFLESERGARVFFAVRWETGTLKKGKWSDILSAFVP